MRVRKRAGGGLSAIAYSWRKAREAGGIVKLWKAMRSEGQFNTVVYEDDDLYRGVKGRDVILIHPLDMARRSLQHRDRVTVRSRVGCLERIRAVAFENIKPGNALMYYPEANVLVERRLDPQSRTPSFKRTPVVVERTGP